MEQRFQAALVSGYERLASWSDLLDQINVFPVADSDTGRNLKISLAPLRQLDGGTGPVAARLLRSATGNSGNIANRFFAAFLKAAARMPFPASVATAGLEAREAVVDPKPGTMLSVFDALSEILSRNGDVSPEGLAREPEAATGIVRHLEASVHATADQLPVLRDAAVVDAGALGMFIYLEAFFQHLAGRPEEICAITDVFAGRLRIASSFEAVHQDGYCVDTLVRADRLPDDAVSRLSSCGESVVVAPDAEYLKIHLHTRDRAAVRDAVSAMGEVVQWSEESLAVRPDYNETAAAPAAIHIMTDAAGSVTREDARQYNMTLLDSYIMIGEDSLPETVIAPGDLYAAMRQGVRVSTAQASVYERHQCYASALNRYERVLYLCVGSVFTGNYDIVNAWKKAHDPKDRMTVIDTGAASGKLGMIALATARFAASGAAAGNIVRFAESAVRRCEEYIFLERLKYLVAGGRLSRTSGFFGDLLHMKPVISPLAEGARKVGVVRTRQEQVTFALDKLAERFSAADAPFILLEYSDNPDWTAGTVKPAVMQAFPKAELVLQPLSLTSGAHMGPGTWALAFLPQT